MKNSLLQKNYVIGQRKKECQTEYRILFINLTDIYLSYFIGGMEIKNRLENIKKSVGLTISYNISEIKKARYIIRYHEDWNNNLREKLKRGGLYPDKKLKIERLIHRNRVIIYGMSQYIIELKSDIKKSQHRLSNNLKKNETDTTRII